MVRKSLIKQAAAVILSISMAFGPCGIGIMPAFAAQEESAQEEAAQEETAQEETAQEETAQEETSTATDSDAQLDEDGFLLDGEVIEDVVSDTATASDAVDELLQESVLLDAELLEASESTWYEDFEYILGSDTIELTEYIGNKTDVVIPGTAIIGGRSYATVIERHNFFQKVYYITSVTFENGVTLLEDASYMFADCRSLASVDLSGLDTSRVKNMSHMFYQCSGLTSIDLSGLDLSNVTDMSSMFAASGELKSADLSDLNTSQLTTMGGMFRGCCNLASINLSGLNMSQVTSMYGMFYDCSGLTSINLNGLNTSRVKSMSHLFYSCSGLTELDLSGLDTSQVTDMSNMFSDCRSLTSINLNGLNTSQVTDMSYLFSGCSGLTELDLSGLDTSQVTNMRGMFQGCSGLTSICLNNFNTSQVTNMGSLFRECSGLTELDLSSFDTSQVTNMGGMFQGCSGLTSLCLNSFNTSQVTNMVSLFCGCSGLTELDLSSFDTSQITDMTYLFSGCSSLTKLDISSFDTSQVTTMNGMFQDCSGLTSLDVSNLKTHRVYSMESMFSGCSGLISIDVSNFNTTKVNSIDYMFRGCSNLSTLDLSGFILGSLPFNFSYLFGFEILPIRNVFENCNFQLLKTPVNAGNYIVLPHHMYNEDGKEYINIPRNLSTSLTLIKGIAVNGITFDQPEITIEGGDSLQLHATILPEDAYNKHVTWTSSNEAVARIDENGFVRAYYYNYNPGGTAIITAKTEDGGYTATCTLKVIKPDLPKRFIRRLYTFCLGREADDEGLNYWKERINSGSIKGIALAGNFVFSNEFTTKNYCNEHFVRQIYPALMNRTPDWEGLNYWVGELDKGMKRETLLNNFTSSSEYKRLCTDAGIELGAKLNVPQYGRQPYGPCAVCGAKTKVVQFVERMYTDCLGRPAEAGGLKFWSEGLVKHTHTARSLLRNFFLCQEIKGKHLSNEEYVSRIYKAMLDRAPDIDGLNYWKGRLDSGESPTAVIDGFIDSAEFIKICEDYGITRK